MTKLIGVTTPNSTFESRTQANQRCCVAGCGNAAVDDIRYSGLCSDHFQADCEAPAAKFIVTYETIDSTEECEKEFSTVAEAEAFIASMEDLLVTCGVSDEHGDIDLDHYCRKHSAHTGEGDICGQCEAEFDKYRDALNDEMLKHQYQLWYLWKGRLNKTDVSNYDEAKQAYYSLNSLNTGSDYTGVRIARYDPTEGCESVLHKFS